MDKDLAKQIAQDNPEEAKPAEPAKRPVMDVKPPTEAAADQTAEPAKPAPEKSAENSSTGGLAEPPPEDTDGDQPAEASKQVKPPKQPKPPKRPGSGVGLAITATVIIVLGIAALVVYAYLQTQ